MVFLVLISLAGLVLLAVSGPMVSHWDVFREIPWTDRIFAGSLPETQIFWGERLPKTFLAFAVGSGLSLAGLMLQTVFRNPLASPFTLGIAGGASLGAVLYLHFAAFFALTDLYILNGSFLALSAFIGALIAILAVWGLSGKGRRSDHRMLLAGIAVNYFFSSLILFLQYISDPSQTFKMIRWTMGGIDYCRPQVLTFLYIITFLAFGWLFLHARELNLLLLGKERAASLGVETAVLNKKLFFLSSILTAILVSVCGPIGFVGLMAPHFARLITGNNHFYLIPISFFGGGLFLAGCFTLSRSIIYPGILPVGILTSLLGGPFFLFFLLKSKIL